MASIEEEALAAAEHENWLDSLTIFWATCYGLTAISLSVIVAAALCGLYARFFCLTFVGCGILWLVSDNLLYAAVVSEQKRAKERSGR